MPRRAFLCPLSAIITLGHVRPQVAGKGDNKGVPMANRPQVTEIPNDGDWSEQDYTDSSSGVPSVMPKPQQRPEPRASTFPLGGLNSGVEIAGYILNLAIALGVIRWSYDVLHVCPAGTRTWISERAAPLRNWCMAAGVSPALLGMLESILANLLPLWVAILAPRVAAWADREGKWASLGLFDVKAVPTWEDALRCAGGVGLGDAPLLIVSLLLFWWWCNSLFDYVDTNDGKRDCTAYETPPYIATFLSKVVIPVAHNLGWISIWLIFLFILLARSGIIGANSKI